MIDPAKAPDPAPLLRLSPALAAALTFLTAGCVLVLEIAAARLLAPYVGVSLITYTAIIGVILAGISLGAWLGGRAADATPPENLIGPTLAVGGLAAMASVPIVSAIGDGFDGGDVLGIVILASAGFVAPATILSAVAPMLVRATIRDLTTSGRLVGRLSAIGTAGAITGTFLTGFVLLGALPTRALVTATGAILVLVGLAVAWRFRGSRAGIAVLLATTVGFGWLAAGSPSPCERESAYYCIAVRQQQADPARRTLVLDNLPHAFVDVNDPKVTQFAYIRWFAAASADIISANPGFEAVHVGGGGFAFPRYLRAVAPASQHIVLELDPVVYDVARKELGLGSDPAIQVRLGDARGTLRQVPDDSADLVVGDAFAGLSVPWHLTTREFIADIDRVLRPNGRYIANLIDSRGLRLVRAEVATLLERFAHVVVVTQRNALRGDPADVNVVVVASHVPVDAAALDAAVKATDSGATAIGDQDVATFAAGAPVLWDDFAPADQLRWGY
jgi:spermidine synthase